LCNHLKNDRQPFCWSIALVVQNGIAEGTGIRAAKQTLTAKGTVAANGAIELNLARRNQEGNPIGAVLAGRVDNDTIIASGQWRNGVAVDGNWKRAQ
jgi:hypothetical protein